MIWFPGEFEPPERSDRMGDYGVLTRLKELEAERDRYRKALETIANHKGIMRTGYVYVEIARDALASPRTLPDRKDDHA